MKTTNAVIKIYAYYRLCSGSIHDRFPTNLPRKLVVRYRDNIVIVNYFGQYNHVAKI